MMIDKLYENVKNKSCVCVGLDTDLSYIPEAFADKYEKLEDDLVIRSGFNTDDFPVEFIISIDAERDLVRFMSKLPFSMPEDKRVDGAIAVCVANNGMVNGSFEYDITKGDILFKMVTSYRGDVDLSTDVFEYMMNVSVGTIDRYNDQFFMISKGMMSIQDFITKEIE